MNVKGTYRTSNSDSGEVQGRVDPSKSHSSLNFRPHRSQTLSRGILHAMTTCIYCQPYHWHIHQAANSTSSILLGVHDIGYRPEILIKLLPPLPFFLTMQLNTRINAFTSGFNLHPLECHLSRQAPKWFLIPQVLDKAPHVMRDLAHRKARASAIYDVSRKRVVRQFVEGVSTRVSLKT